MKKMMMAAAIVLGATVAQAAPGEISIVVCKSISKGFDHGTTVRLARNISERKNLLYVSQMWIGGTRTNTEVAKAADVARLPIGGGMVYESKSYVFRYNATTSPTAGFYRGSLFNKITKSNEELRCNLTR